MLCSHLFAAGQLPFGQEAGDQFLERGDNTILQISFSNTSFIFNGRPYNNVFVSTDGIISLGTSFTGSGVQDFPIVSPPLIAPFWLNVLTTVSGSVSYRFINDQDLIFGIDGIVSLLLARSFTSTSILVVTWHAIPLVFSSNISGTSQALLISNGIESFVVFTYSNGTDHPSGAEVGINVGDGLNFLSDASVSDGDSNRIARGTNIPQLELLGVYYYRVDNLESSITPSPPDVCLNDGQLQLIQAEPLLRTSVDGIQRSGITALLQVCVAGRFGGICRRGFDDVDAGVACRGVGYLGGESTV